MTRRQRRTLVALAAAALVAALLAGACWHLFGPLSTEERAFVGEWEARDDDRPGQPFAVLAFRPDRTGVTRFPDQTGALTTAYPPWRWRLSGGRLETQPDGPADRLKEVFRRRGGSLELTPDGPDRFRFRYDSGRGDAPHTGTYTRRAPEAE